MNKYLVVIERAEQNYAAFSPDLPGCVAAGATREETLAEMKAAVAMHIEGLKEDGLPIPEPSSSADYVAV